MLKLLRYLDKRQRGQALLTLVFVVLQVWLDLTLPDYMATITSLAETPGSTMGQILVQGGYMMLCAAGSLVCNVICVYLASRVAAGLSRTLREKVFNQAFDLSRGDVDRFGAASLVNRCTNDITQIQNLVSMGLSVIVKAPVMAIWAVVKIVGFGWEWTLATAAPGARLTLFSQMVVFSNYGMQVILAFVLLNMIFVLLPRAQMAAERVSEVIEAEPAVTDGVGVLDSDVAAADRGRIEFRDVSFTYPDDGTPGLSHVSFTAEPGQTVAVVGRRTTRSRATTWAPRSRWPSLPTLSRAWRAALTPPSSRAGGTSLAASASAWPWAAPSPTGPRSLSSTTRSAPSTSRPTASCARPSPASAPARPSPSSPSAWARCATPTSSS